MNIENINGNILVFENPDNHQMLGGYYHYCINIIKNRLKQNNEKINIIFGNINHNFDNNNKILKIDIQCEHTLVKCGGRNSHNALTGKVKYNDNFYLIRINQFNYYNTIDGVIEYSLPNVHNISTNESLNEYLKKIIYVAPTYYDINFDKSSKTDIITTFIDNSNGRRSKILDNLKSLNIDNKKIQNCFDYLELEKIYKNSKILVNVHQTEEHHTFEEFRVLPAIMKGILIVSEKVPLTEIIPYNEYIIWADYDDIAKVTADVNNNYEDYYNKIFGDSKLLEILELLKNKNEISFDNLIK